MHTGQSRSLAPFEKWKLRCVTLARSERLCKPKEFLPEASKEAALDRAVSSLFWGLYCTTERKWLQHALYVFVSTFHRLVTHSCMNSFDAYCATTGLLVVALNNGSWEVNWMKPVVLTKESCGIDLGLLSMWPSLWHSTDHTESPPRSIGNDSCFICLPNKREIDRLCNGGKLSCCVRWSSSGTGQSKGHRVPGTRSHRFLDSDFSCPARSKGEASGYTRRCTSRYFARIGVFLDVDLGRGQMLRPTPAVVPPPERGQKYSLPQIAYGRLFKRRSPWL